MFRIKDTSHVHGIFRFVATATTTAAALAFFVGFGLVFIVVGRLVDHFDVEVGKVFEHHLSANLFVFGRRRRGRALLGRGQGGMQNGRSPGQGRIRNLGVSASGFVENDTALDREGRQFIGVHLGGVAGDTRAGRSVVRHGVEFLVVCLLRCWLWLFK